MVDSRFLVVTTLCYVGIFAVIFIVCCCAWTRYLRNEGRGSSRLRKKRPARAGGGRRLINGQNTQPTEYPTASTPMCAPERQDFAEQNMYFPVQRTSDSIQRTNRYPIAGHFAMFDYYQTANALYPTGQITGTYGAQVTADAGSVAYGDTSQGGFSAEDFSDATSSRFGCGEAETVRLGVESPSRTPRTLTPSVESVDDKTQVESDVTSQA